MLTKPTANMTELTTRTAPGRRTNLTMAKKKTSTPITATRATTGTTTISITDLTMTIISMAVIRMAATPMATYGLLVSKLLGVGGLKKID